MKKILIVEDDQNLLSALEDYFSNLNTKVFAYNHSRGLLKKIAAIQPDLGIFDVWVNPLGGDELCKLIKEDPQLPNFPIVLISAKDQLNKTAEEAKADHYLNKPFKLSELGRICLEFIANKPSLEPSVALNIKHVAKTPR